MPTVASIAARIEREGEPITLTRVTDAGPVSAGVTAFVRGYRPQELVNDIQQGDREMRIAPSALEAQGFPGAPVRPDQVLIGDAYATVQSCETVRLRGVPAMHVVQVRGG